MKEKEEKEDIKEEKEEKREEGEERGRGERGGGRERERRKYFLSTVPWAQGSAAHLVHLVGNTGILGHRHNPIFLRLWKLEG